MHKDLPFARLTEKQLEKLKETETFINRQPDRNTEEEEIILLAFKQENH